MSLDQTSSPPPPESNNLLSCCSFNVHHFSTAYGRSNLTELYKYLHKNNFDIVCLNEVYEDSEYSHPLRDLVYALNSSLPEEVEVARPYQYRSGPTNYESNIILSKYPILFQEKKDVGRGERSVLGIKIDHPLVRNVFVTHLDHVSENKRVLQLKRVLSFMKHFIDRKLVDYPNDENKNFILLGDFNSMRMDDYTDKFWDYLIKQRIQYGWEAPDTQVTSLLFNEPTTPESHSTEEADEPKLKMPLVDCWKVLNPDIIFEGEKGTGSSRLDTRIDYVISNTELQPYLKQSWIDSDASGISDHLPVVVLFEF
ncbi:phosphatase [Naegleria gruberi]|uniref:Phosphatase n=1 Tax=Naegleria gruberi TaxID=5762 RepID=D2V608_NAEGR|nr:phosphatase [Naegleria gruberi]EFC47740.1 phosphatase [Naegleria gruberi]|eukprot:XP_002680484.1 phosphatase [Naegleria gruberi]